MCLRRIPAQKLGDFETLPHAFFRAIFAHVLSIIQISSPLPRNSCLNPSNTKSETQDYYMLNLKDPIYTSIAIAAWLGNYSSHASNRKSA